jgi:hypothetical protein
MIEEQKIRSEEEQAHQQSLQTSADDFPQLKDDVLSIVIVLTDHL